jgi:hypothetical protein
MENEDPLVKEEKYPILRLHTMADMAIVNNIYQTEFKQIQNLISKIS